MHASWSGATTFAHTVISLSAISIVCVSNINTESALPGRSFGGSTNVHFEYVNQSDVHSERTVRPLGLFFWGRAWTAVTWCELRDAFRSFRPDRMQNLEVLDERVPDEPERDLQTFLQWVIQRGRARW